MLVYVNIACGILWHKSMVFFALSGDIEYIDYLDMILANKCTKAAYKGRK